MTDTLRYYFSAIFQGFAAITTLGAMYFLYFFDKVETQKNKIIGSLNKYCMDLIQENRDFIDRNGIISYIKEKLLPIKKGVPQYDTVRFLVERYDSIISKENKIRNYLPRLLKEAIVILMLSLISLFLIGYNIYIDYILLLSGILLLLLSFKYLSLVKDVIIKISDKE